MTAFVVIGCIGLLVVIASLVLGDLLEGLFDAVDVDAGSGLFSAPVIGSALAAFGFGAAVATSAGAVTGVAALLGVVGGAAFGGVALVITRALMHMPTDESVRLGDIVGKTATVVTRIPEGGFGEVTLIHLGQRLKLSARAEDAVAAGTSVVVTAVTSASSVLVEPEASFWRLERGKES